MIFLCDLARFFQVCDQLVDITVATVEHGADLGALTDPEADAFDDHVEKEILARPVRDQKAHVKR